MTLWTLSSSEHCRRKEKQRLAIFETTADDFEFRAPDIPIGKRG